MESQGLLHYIQSCGLQTRPNAPQFRMRAECCWGHVSSSSCMLSIAALLPPNNNNNNDNNIKQRSSYTKYSGTSMSCRFAASSQQIDDYSHVLRVELNSCSGLRRRHCCALCLVWVILCLLVFVHVIK